MSGSKKKVSGDGPVEEPEAPGVSSADSPILNVSLYIPNSGKPYFNPKIFSEYDQNTLKLACPTTQAKSNLGDTSENLIDVQSDANVVPSTSAIGSVCDLMSFSQGDVFETENISKMTSLPTSNQCIRIWNVSFRCVVTGREICPIITSGKQLTGVDVFLHERQKEDKCMSCFRLQSFHLLITQIDMRKIQSCLWSKL